MGDDVDIVHHPAEIGMKVHPLILGMDNARKSKTLHDVHIKSHHRIQS